MPTYGGEPNETELSKGALQLWELIQEMQPCTAIDLQGKTKMADRTVRLYLKQLMGKTLIRELPNIGRAKLYARIDYTPIFDEKRPLAQRWEIYSKANNTRFSLGELATHYGNGVTAKSEQAAELLFKAPALLVYFAQENELSNEQKEEQLNNLKELLKEACDQLDSAISVFNQLITDTRLWRSDLLDMFRVSPDYVLNSDIPKIIERLREDEDNDQDS